MVTPSDTLAFLKVCFHFLYLGKKKKKLHNGESSLESGIYQKIYANYISPLYHIDFKINEVKVYGVHYCSYNCGLDQ